MPRLLAKVRTSTAAPAAVLHAALFALVFTVGGCASGPPVPAVLKTSSGDQFYDLAREAGVEPLLAGEGPVTVFAPTDDAVARAAGEIAEWRKIPGRLKSVVLSHVVKGEAIDQIDLAQRTTLTAANGKAVSVTTSGEQVSVGGANLVGPAVKAKNGVVYPVDRLVMP